MESEFSCNSLTSKFLWDSALMLRSCNLKNVLPVVSQLREKCVTLARKGVDCKSVFQPSEVCSYCGNIWSEGSFKIKVINQSKRMKKLKKQFETDVEVSSKFKRNLANLLVKRKDNILRRKCCVCSKRIKIGLRKPKAIKPLLSESVISADDSMTVQKKRKRKSKKDSFSGLNASAVVNARLSRLSRDSFGSNTSLSYPKKDSILSNTTVTRETAVDISLNETSSFDSDSSKISFKEQPSFVSSTNPKKQKQVQITPVQKQKSKKNIKKSKKSLVADFLNFI